MRKRKGKKEGRRERKRVTWSLSAWMPECRDALEASGTGTWTRLSPSLRRLSFLFPPSSFLPHRPPSTINHRTCDDYLVTHSMTRYNQNKRIWSLSIRTDYKTPPSHPSGRSALPTEQSRQRENQMATSSDSLVHSPLIELRRA